MAVDAVCSCSYHDFDDYTSKVRRHIIAELGDKRMGEVSLDDIQLALVSVSKNLHRYISRS